MRFPALILIGISAVATAQSPVTLVHVHGLAYSVDGERLMIPSHHGLAVYENGKWSKAPGPQHDYMGFSATANYIYSSGHPAPGAGLVNPFGLLRSRDGAKTSRRHSFVYADLNDFLADLDRRTLLAHVADPVSPKLEIAAVIERAIDREAERLPIHPLMPIDPYPARRVDALYKICSQRLGADADADRATVVVHEDADGSLHLPDGTGLPRSVAQRLSHRPHLRSFSYRVRFDEWL